MLEAFQEKMEGILENLEAQKKMRDSMGVSNKMLHKKSHTNARNNKKVSEFLRY